MMGDYSKRYKACLFRAYECDVWFCIFSGVSFKWNRVPEAFLDLSKGAGLDLGYESLQE